MIDVVDAHAKSALKLSEGYCESAIKLMAHARSSLLPIEETTTMPAAELVLPDLEAVEMEIKRLRTKLNYLRKMQALLKADVAMADPEKEEETNGD
jgi:hypothetical protein